MLAYGRKGIGYDPLKLVPKVVGEKLLDIHYRGKVFLGKPRAALAYLVPLYVARITPGSFTPDTIVLPKTLLQELLREGDLEEASVVLDSERLGGLKERVGVPDIEQGNALLPNVNHRAIESEDVFLARLLGLLFGNVLHDYRNWGENCSENTPAVI